MGHLISNLLLNAGVISWPGLRLRALCELLLFHRVPAVAGFAVLFCAVSPSLLAQEPKKSWPIQFHGFFSQGFAKSDRNNYLTMKTSEGTFAFTDGGLSASMQVTKRLRVGAQAYVRNIGALGDFRPILDWAVADYKVTDWLSIRGGKVKTVYGLYNDSQDMESLHTWAILPQSVYALDLRSSSFAHLGGDVGGEVVGLKDHGSIAYTAYSGRRLDDRYGGYRMVASQNGVELDSVTGWMAGGDLRWVNLRPGLTLGLSYFEMPFEGAGKIRDYNLPVRFKTHGKSHIYYGDYQRGNLHLTAEYSRGSGAAEVMGLPGVSTISEPFLGWYASAAYRLSSHLELGAYHSRFISDTDRDWSDPGNHIYDQVITARIDINRQWSLKVEGHVIDGNGSVYSAHGFYLRQNPEGFHRKTNMVVFRTGYTF